MPKVKHDFFSDPNWPLPGQTLQFPPNCSPPSENTAKDEEKVPSTTEPANLEQALFELNAKSALASEHIDKLKMSSEEGESVSCDLEEMALKARDLLQSVYMESESGENQTVLKVEEKFFSGADDLSEYSFYFPLNHYRILSKETKQFMVEEVERTNLSYVSRKYGISPNNLYRWKKHCERKAGAGRKVSDRGMEERLIEWIRGELGKKRGNLTRKEIQNQAITFSSDPNFKASKGWFERFVKRNKTLDLAHYFGMRGMRSNRQGNQAVSLYKAFVSKRGDEGEKQKEQQPTRSSRRLSELMLKEMDD